MRRSVNVFLTVLANVEVNLRPRRVNNRRNFLIKDIATSKIAAAAICDRDESQKGTAPWHILLAVLHKSGRFAAG